MQKKTTQIGRIIKSSGITATFIAKKLKVTPAAVIYWMNGRNTPTPKHLEKLNTLLNTQITITRKK
jgi:transcriptional regulator with XRE-family HTH domain